MNISVAVMLVATILMIVAIMLPKIAHYLEKKRDQ